MYLKDLKMSAWTFGTHSVDSGMRTCICSAGFKPDYSDIFVFFPLCIEKNVKTLDFS